MYEKELSHKEKDRQELANAEKLFGLPITMYADLMQVQKEMSGLRQVYDIYKAQKVSYVLHCCVSLVFFFSSPKYAKNRHLQSMNCFRGKKNQS